MLFVVVVVLIQVMVTSYKSYDFHENVENLFISIPNNHCVALITFRITKPVCNVHLSGVESLNTKKKKNEEEEKKKRNEKENVGTVYVTY